MVLSRSLPGFSMADLGPVRVGRRLDLLALQVSDRRSGYPVETLIKAATAGWRIQEFDLSYRRRTTGTRSKVSGSLLGTVTATGDILRIVRRQRGGMNRATVLIMAKAPVAGRVKTRLCPSLSPAHAADLAAAALLDTLAAAAGTGTRTVVALDGELQDARRPAQLRAALSGVRVVEQRGDGFAARLVAAHTDAGGRGPLLQIGMDTPQVTPIMLTSAVATLAVPGVDAVLGPASDGGWWALGLNSAIDSQVLREVPMSQPSTGELTLAALQAIGCRVEILPTLTDVDHFDDAVRVSRLAPGALFAAGVRLLLTQASVRVA